MDKRLIEEKLESLRRCVARVALKCPGSADQLADDADAQDIIALNLTRAVQLCVDIASHILSEVDSPAPATMGEALEGLARVQVLDAETAQQLRKAVGFRNIAIHRYQTIDWKVVYDLCTKRLDDFRKFAGAVSAYNSQCR